jgi:hypothetical protein
MEFLTSFSNPDTRDVAIKITQALAVVAASVYMRNSNISYVRGFSSHLSRAAIGYSGIADHLTSTVLSCSPFPWIFNKVGIMGLSDYPTAALNLSAVIGDVIGDVIKELPKMVSTSMFKQSIWDSANANALIQTVSFACSWPRDAVQFGIGVLKDLRQYKAATITNDTNVLNSTRLNPFATEKANQNALDELGVGGSVKLNDTKQALHVVTNSAIMWLVQPMVIATCCSRVQITNQPILNGFVQMFVSAASSYVFGLLYAAGEHAVTGKILSQTHSEMGLEYS